MTASAQPTTPSGPGAGLSLALTFLTRIPVRRGRPAELAPGALGRAAIWFPVVGALVGAVLGGTRLVADLVLPAGAATALAVAAAVAVTGALHEDGLADTADGLGAHAVRARRLEIMRDPRLGTFGTVALVLSLLLAWTLLGGLDGRHCLLAAVAAHALARWAMLLAAGAFPPARPTGAGTLLVVGHLRLATATAAAIAIALGAVGPAAGATAAATAVAVTAALGGLATRLLGGVTGDVYGATGKAVEVAAIAAVAAVWG